MKLVTYEVQGATRVGLLDGDLVRDLTQLSLWGGAPPRDIGGMLENWPLADLTRALEQADQECAERDSMPLDAVVLRAPILRPPMIVAIGRNYRAHAEEQGASLPARPLLFAKAPTCVIGPGETILLPRSAPDSVDVEVELGVIIGRPGQDVAPESAMDHVFGYTIINDVSARDVQKGEKQWFRGKSYRTFAPCGPAVVTHPSLDWRNLQLESRWKSTVMQSDRTSSLIFDVPHLIADISTVVPLVPGMIIATGTPSGVGAFREPPVFLAPGDVVECEIEGIGVLSNPVAAQEA